MRKVVGPALAALLGVAGAVLSAVLARGSSATLNAWAIAVVVAAYAVVGLLILWRHPGHRVGLVVLLGTAIWGPGEGLLGVAVARLRDDPQDTTGALAAPFGSAARGLGWLLLVLVLPLLFPDGRRAGSQGVRRWAWRCAGVVIVGFTVASLVTPTSTDDRLADVDNPIGLPKSWAVIADLLSLVSLLTAVATVALAVTTLVQRWRRDDELVRQQLLWFAIAFACPVVLFPLALAGLATPWMFGLASIPVPVAIAVAVLQHRLYDIQLAVNRSLTYGTLSVLIAGLYAVVVGGVGAILRARGAPWLPWVAAGVVAVSFAPLHSALQQAANKLTYGQWSQPAEVLAATGRRLSDASDVPGLLRSLTAELGSGLGLEYVEIRDGRGLSLARYGDPRLDVESLPLAAYGEQVGVLRWARTRLRGHDRDLLADVARQLGGLVHAASLLDQISDAQERLVVAREEERKRLRRDLHDGLGPALAGLTLQVDTLRNRVGGGGNGTPVDPDAELLRIRGGIQATVFDVRRIVEGLRPPALDDLGLAGALEHLTDRLTAGTHLRVDVDLLSLPRVPAAVEVAAYRIAQEALTNAVRHAKANHVRVRLVLEPRMLALEVADDGSGSVGARDGGVGLASMHERATELGGTLTLDATPGVGTTVLARLPYLLPAGTPDELEVSES